MIDYSELQAIRNLVSGPSSKLRTPLQVKLHLTLAFEAGYQTGEKPVTTELVGWCCRASSTN